MTAPKKVSSIRQVSATSFHELSSPPVKETESNVSRISFKHWHKRMQTQHQILERSGRLGFGLWKWCFIVCKPCRMFDSIAYDKKISKCCLKFSTFKFICTILLIMIYVYSFLYCLFKESTLPGGTIFFLFLLYVPAYLVGYLLMLIGLPPMFGNLLVGLVFGNVPQNWLPAYDKHTLELVAQIFENILLIIALIRSGLLLDLSRIKSRVQFILRISLFPLFSEFACLCVCGHYLLGLPWDWSAMQGSILCIVSLASLTSVMQKNIKTGYGEDKHLSTVLIAASAMDVIVGIFLYVLCVSCIFQTEDLNKLTFWKLGWNMVKEVLMGLAVGTVCGLLAAFFPDKRHSEAAALRIVVIGTGSLAVAGLLSVLAMQAAGVLGTLTMCLVASNMWEELGWHESSNPVQYFYTMFYYLGSPMCLSLIGFSLKFSQSNGKEIGLSIGLIFLGLVAREATCFITTLGKLYPTTLKEKIFICIAWFSKGSFQVLLAAAIHFAIIESTDLDEDTKKKFSSHSKLITQTTILAILLTTPLVCYSLTLLTPILLTKTSPMAGDTNLPQTSAPLNVV